MRQTQPAASFPVPHSRQHRRDSSPPAHPSGTPHMSRSRDPLPAPKLHQTQSTHHPDAPQHTLTSSPLCTLQVRIIEQQLRRNVSSTASSGSPHAPEQTSSDAEPKAQTQSAPADAPASHSPYAKPAHIPDAPHPAPASTHPDAPWPPPKPRQSKGSERHHKSASSVGKDGPAASHRSADGRAQSSTLAPPPASPSVLPGRCSPDRSSPRRSQPHTLQAPSRESSIEVFTLFPRELFRVLQSRLSKPIQALRKNHRCRHHRPKQRAPPHLIHAGNPSKPAIPQRLLRSIAAHQLLQHPLFCGSRRDRFRSANRGSRSHTLQNECITLRATHRRKPRPEPWLFELNLK